MKNKMKRIGALLCALVLVIGSCFTGNEFSVSASDTTTDGVVGTIPLDTTVTKEITATDTTISASIASSETNEWAINASAYSMQNLQLVMDIEVEVTDADGNSSDDMSAFFALSGQIELTSSGTADTNEINYPVSSLNWRSGTNEYALNLSAFSSVSGGLDYSDINFMRIYMKSWPTDFIGNTVTFKISNVRIVDFSERETFLPTLFSDGMMFQQEKPMNIWGYGTAGDSVEATISLGETGLETKTTTVDENGKWELAFTACKGSYDSYTIDITVGETAYEINDVVVGELWIAGGQSNMELKVSSDMNAEEILADAAGGENNSFIRIFLEPTYPYGKTEGQQLIDAANDVPGAYWGYGNTHAGAVSSVAYNFAKNLQEELGVPVGIINSAIGGTVIEGWLSREAIEGDAEVKEALVENDLYFNEETWTTAAAGDMSTLYNQKIGPLEGMNIAGVIWYQGESNSGRSEIYDIELALLKKSWGTVFGFEDGTMPLIFTQVAPYRYNNGAKNQQHLGWLAMYMEKGWKLCGEDTTAMLTIYDLPLDHVKDGKSSDPIHPRTKIPVAKRFSDAAINMVYDGTAEYTAAVYESMEVVDNAIQITFAHVGEGLKSTDGSDDIHGFTIAGADGVYVNAQAQIVDADTVKVWNESITEPQNVMYAFDNFNQGSNLCNSSGIPASPFRTVELEDTTYYPDESITYFTAQDWMYADKDVWVYDTTNTENDNRYTGYRPSFSVENGSYEYDSDIKTEGTASMKVTYDTDFSVSPILTYESIQQDWSKFTSLSVSMRNPNASDIDVTMTITSSGEIYTVSTADGADSVTLSSAGETFTTATFDLTQLKLNGEKVTYATAVLSELTDVTFQITASESGTMYFDAFSFGREYTANAVRDWTIISEDTTTATTAVSKDKLGIDLSAYYDASSTTAGSEDLALYILLYLGSEDAVATMERAWVELGNHETTADYNEISWKLATLAEDLELHVGMNAICLSLAKYDATSNELGYTNSSSGDQYGTFSLNSKVNKFRVYSNTEGYTAGWSNITINEAKIVDITPCVEKYSSATPGTAPEPTVNVPSNYVFAGWYTDEECTSVLKKAVTNGEAFAKFVAGDVLSVKAQYSTTVTEAKKTLPFDSESEVLKKNGSTSFVTVDKNGESADVLQKTGNSNVRFQVELSNAIDITSYKDGYLVFDMYINDTSYIGTSFTSCVLQLGSNGYTGSCMTYNSLLSELETGWKTYKIPLSSFGTQSNMDYSNLNFFRIYFLPNTATTSADLVMMLDNVHVVTDGTNLRLITTVDSDMYQNVGFDITIGDKTVTAVSNTVYTTLYGINSTNTVLAYAPQVFSAQSEYFNTYTLGNVPISDKEIIVTPYWTTLDGTKVTGTSRTIIMSEVVNVE